MGPPKKPAASVRAFDAAANALHAGNLRCHLALIAARAVESSTASSADKKSAETKIINIKNQVAADNWGLAVEAARPYRIYGSKADANDLIASGMLALWEAFETWDPARGTLATWAHMPIAGAVGRQVRQADFGQMSYGDYSARPRVRQATAELADKLGATPSHEQVAAAMGGMTASMVERIRTPRAVSLDTPIGDSDGDSTLGSLIAGSRGIEDTLEEPVNWGDDLIVPLFLQITACLSTATERSARGFVEPGEVSESAAIDQAFVFLRNL